MLIGMRNAMLAGGGSLTAKSYVQDGLVAMWDGIENAGWGTHNESATTWKDLIGSNDMTLNQSNPTKVEDDGILGTNRSVRVASFTPISSYGTLEIVLKAASNSGYCVIDPCRGNGWEITITNWKIGTGKYTYTGAISRAVPISAGVPMSLSVEMSAQYVTSAIFKDGVQDTSGTASDDWWTVDDGAIGTSAYYRSFVGKMYAVRLYSRALTAAEVAANYAVDKARFNLA